MLLWLHGVIIHLCGYVLAREAVPVQPHPCLVYYTLKWMTLKC